MISEACEGPRGEKCWRLKFAKACQVMEVHSTLLVAAMAPLCSTSLPPQFSELGLTEQNPPCPDEQLHCTNPQPAGFHHMVI